MADESNSDDPNSDLAAGFTAYLLAIQIIETLRLHSVVPVDVLDDLFGRADEEADRHGPVLHAPDLLPLIRRHLARARRDALDYGGE